MRRLVWAFAGHTYHIVGNLISGLIDVASYHLKLIDIAYKNKGCVQFNIF